MASVQGGATAQALDCVLEWLSAAWWCARDSLLQVEADIHHAEVEHYICSYTARQEAGWLAMAFADKRAAWEDTLKRLRLGRDWLRMDDKDCGQEWASLRLAVKSIGTPP